MRKSVLRTLGQLLALEESLWNQLAEQPHSEELRQTYRLVRIVKKNLEDQQRGLRKSKLNYLGAAKKILELGEDTLYKQLHKMVTKVLLGTQT